MNTNRYLFGLAALILVLAIVAACAPMPTPTTAPTSTLTATPKSTPIVTPESFSFKGKTVTVLVPHGVGGGADIWARLTGGQYLSRFLPGNPNVIIRNMSGAGGVTGVNWAYNEAKPDGLTIVFTSESPMIPAYLGDKSVKYDLSKMTCIAAKPESALFWMRTGIISQNKDIVKPKGLVYADTSWPVALPMIMADKLLGLNELKIVFGFASGGDKRRGFLTGEFQLSRDTSLAYDYYSDMLKKGELLIAFSTGFVDAKGKVVRDPVLPDMLTLGELYEQVHGKSPTGIAWDAYKWAIGTLNFKRNVLLPPNTPNNVIEIYKEAFTKLANDPTYKKDIQALSPDPFPFFVGQEAMDMYRSVNVTPEIRKYVIELVERHGVKVN